MRRLPAILFRPLAIMAMALSAVFCNHAFAQAREVVLYSFGSNPNDGDIPNGGLVFDSSGNLYGTTQRGGAYGGGTVFELTPTLSGGWTETVIYNFCSQAKCADGGVPEAGLIFDAAGNLYGTAAIGGMYSGGTCAGAGCGTVFQLSPPSVPGGTWTQTVLWNFRGNLGGDGAQPRGRLTWDTAGNLYGTTVNGPYSFSLGTVFELSRNVDGGWTESILYAFCKNGPPCPDGSEPNAGVSFDDSANLYGTTESGGFDDQWGTVYRLSPQEDGTWEESTLHQFTPEGGGNPMSEVNFDQEGNLYGTFYDGRSGDPAQCGGLWKLSPRNDGSYSASALLLNPSGANGCGPAASLFMDSKADTVFATTEEGSPLGKGTVFNVTGKKQTVLYEFCQQPGCADGSNPAASFTMHGDALFSSTTVGGSFNKGVVFEILR
jgi:uncharacterized repeat protein (TIGR03803 family)